MEVKIMYSKRQLNAAARYISDNNYTFQGQIKVIKNSILDTIKRMALEPDSMHSGTMGYTVIVDRTFEGVDSDCNTAFFEILVDPNLAGPISESDYVEEIISDE